MSMSRSSRAEVFGTRLMRLGCGLMTLGPLVVLVTTLVLAWPLFLQLVPRGVRPIQPAWSTESLLIVTTLANDEGRDITRALDNAVLDLSGRYYLYNSRFERLNQTPTSTDEARAVAQDYEARFLLWGQVNASGSTLHVEILDPLNFTEPRTLTFTTDSLPDDADIDVLARALVALNALHGDDTYTADTLFMSLPADMLVEEGLRDYYVALAALLSGRETAAQSLLEDAREQAPNNAPVLGLSALLAQQNGDTDQALEWLNAYIAIDDTNADIYEARARLVARQGDFEMAEADLQRALERDAAKVTALEQLAALYRVQGSYGAAVEVLTQLLALETDNTARYYIMLGEVHAAADDEAAALTAYTAGLDAVETDQDRNLLLMERGYAYLAAGEAANARADFTALTDTAPNPYVGLGLTYWVEGDEAQARAIWEEAFGVGSVATDGGNENTLASALNAAGYTGPALSYSDRALSVNPQDDEYLYTHGLIMLNLGNYEEALADFDEAIDNGLSSATVNRRIGDAYYGLEAWDDALLFYEDYLDFYTLLPTDDFYGVLARMNTAREMTD